MSLVIFDVHDFSCDCGRCVGRSAHRISFILRYMDTKNDLDLHEGVIGVDLMTISSVQENVVRIFDLDGVLPQDIRLVKIICTRNHDGRKRAQEGETSVHTGMTLQQLGVENEDMLCFEPVRDLPPLKPLKLTIVSPDGKRRVEFTWYKQKTTVKMLMEFVIQTFSLQNIQRERIHLTTYIGEISTEVLSRLRLIDEGIVEKSVIYIHIVGEIPSSTTTTTEKETFNVHIECIYDEDKPLKFDLSTTATIHQLRKTIEEKVNSTILNLKLYKESDEEIITNDLKRDLNSFGIKENETIFVLFALKSPKSIVSNKSSSSSVSKCEEDKVIVEIRWLNIFRLSIPMSIKTTIGDLCKLDAELLQENKRLAVLNIRTDRTEVNINQTHRSLADLGIELGEKVYVDIGDVKDIHSSIVNSSNGTRRKPTKAECDYSKPLGLDNLGNTCYMGSAFQCLARIPPLTDYFLNQMNINGENVESTSEDHWNPFDKVGVITGNYANLLWNLLGYNEENNDSYSIAASNMQQILSSHDSHYHIDNQHDVQEFTSFFLDVIHKEMKRDNGKDRTTIIKKLFFGQIKSVITCGTCNHEESTTNPIGFLSIPLNLQERKFYIDFVPRDGQERHHEVIVPMDGRVEDVVKLFAEQMKDPQLFQFSLVTISGEELDFQKPLVEIVQDAILIFEQDKSNGYPEPKTSKTKIECTLENCLRDFLSTETLENQWICSKENCRKNDLAMKRLKFTILPPVLMIQFKRFAQFNGVRQKVETFVKYPIEGLDLQRFLPDSSEETIYDLVAVCNHTGYMFSGHYTATTRCVIDNKVEWYHFDDACVNRIPSKWYQDDIVTRNAYLLFYVRRDLLNSNNYSTPV